MYVPLKDYLEGVQPQLKLGTERSKPSSKAGAARGVTSIELGGHQEAFHVRERSSKFIRALRI